MGVNWKDGVGNVTDEQLNIAPLEGSLDGSTDFSSVINKGLDRALELEISGGGITKKLTVTQEGCREAYVTTEGGRYITADGQVYGVLKSDAPCECGGC